MSSRRYTSPKIVTPLHIAFLVFYLWIAAQIPYTHDDWDWGLSIGMSQFLNATVNSRYVGNFFEIIMTRSELLKVLIMGFGYFLIPYFLSKLAVKTAKRANARSEVLLFLIANCILLTMNRGMWRQVYGWVAGYANFAISALFMSPWICEMLHAFDQDLTIQKESPIKLVLIFLHSVLCQLFIENLAIYHTLLGLALCIVYYIRLKKIPLKQWIMVVGFSLGLIIMFSSSIYGTLLETGEAVGSYRQIPFLGDGTIIDAILSTARTAIFLTLSLYTNHFILSLTILLLMTLLIHRSHDLPKKCQSTLPFGECTSDAYVCLWICIR